MSKTVAEILDHLALKPNELLVIRVSPRTTMAAAQNLKDQIETYDLGARVVIVAAEQVAAVSTADGQEIRIEFGSLPPDVAEEAERRLLDAFNKAAGV